MKKIAFVCFVLFLLACQKQPEYLTCPDNITKVLDLSACPAPKPTCPVCDDGNSCTRDDCSAATNYTCSFQEIKPCAGNGICEEGEFGRSDDCKSCDDSDKCTADTYSYQLARCTYDPISPCCGNKACDTGETYVNCPSDCRQVFSVVVTNYEYRSNFDGSYGDLTGSEFTYIIVDFVIHNIGIDRQETLNYKTSKGYYYDPFKMRLEDDAGKLYNVEYDSDILSGYLDYVILPMGDTKGAALLFVIPRSAEHIRLVAYDRYGSRLDTAEVY